MISDGEMSDGFPKGVVEKDGRKMTVRVNPNTRVAKIAKMVRCGRRCAS